MKAKITERSNTEITFQSYVLSLRLWSDVFKPVRIFPFFVLLIPKWQLNILGKDIGVKSIHSSIHPSLRLSLL
jgi:hypothetical protein